MDVIEEAVKKYDKDLVLQEKQREALLHLVGRKGDLIVSLPVGYGKSVIFHLLPHILGEPGGNSVVLVISPLNTIQKDQRTVLRSHGISSCRLDICTNVLCSDDDDEDTEYLCTSEENMEEVKRGKFQIVFCHPEALFNTQKGKELLSSQFNQRVTSVVLDECHIIERWGDEFRVAFKALPTLKAFFPEAAFLALSGTMTTIQKRDLPLLLGFKDFKIIECSPDKPNIFLEKYEKEPTSDVEEEYEKIVNSLCDKLYVEKEKFPITLVFLPVYYMSRAIMYLNNLFKPNHIDDASCLYSAVCSGQDNYVIDKTLRELKKENPQIRLVLTTSILGMGFDPDNVTHVVHLCPPRNISQYFQEIGRAGRRGQPSVATLYFSARNIARNLPGITDDIIQYCKNDTSCLRNNILSVFGFEKDPSIIDCECCCICKKKCKCDECLILSIDLSDL